MKIKGSDPILDEDNILVLLAAPAGYDTVGAIQAGTAQALVDMFDRGMTRAEFCEHASICLALYAQCAKLWLLKNIQIANDTEPLTAEAFNTARDSIVKIMAKQSEEIIAVVKRLQLCPSSEDRVH